MEENIEKYLKGSYVKIFKNNKEEYVLSFKFLSKNLYHPLRWGGGIYNDEDELINQLKYLFHSIKAYKIEGIEIKACKKHGKTRIPLTNEKLNEFIKFMNGYSNHYLK